MTRLGVLLNERRSIDTPLVQVCDATIRDASLLGGDNAGEWNDWYEWAIPAADDVDDLCVHELRKEGLIE